MPKINAIDYIILEAAYAKDSTYFGNVLVDNIVEYTIMPNIKSDTVMCEGSTF